MCGREKFWGIFRIRLVAPYVLIAVIVVTVLYLELGKQYYHGSIARACEAPCLGFGSI